MKANHEVPQMPQNIGDQTPEDTKATHASGVKGENQIQNESSAEVATTSADASIETPAAPAETLPETLREPIDLEKLYTEDAIENPDAEFDIAGQLASTEKSLVEVEGNIERLKTAVDEKKAELARVRSELGMDAPAEEESVPEEQRLQQLLEQKEALESQKEEAEEMKELQELMDEMDKMPPEMRVFIINNGTTPEGKPLQTKSGKDVNKEVAKSLAQSVEDGVKKLTKSVLKVALGIVKGIFKGIFAIVKGGEKEQA